LTPEPTRFCVTRCAQTITQKRYGSGATEASVSYTDMNSRSALIAVTSTFTICGMGAIIYMLGSSLNPSAGAGSTLPRIDISGMEAGSFLVHETPYASQIAARYLALKDYDANLYIYRVLSSEQGVQMPDLDWKRWGGSCLDFGPELIEGSLVPGGNITCRDGNLSDWEISEWNWTYTGENLGKYTGNMEKLPFVVEGDYAIIGKYDS